MALLTDDSDMRETKMYMEVGGNGDYYINLIEGESRLQFRVSMSGGNAPTDVKLSVANLFRTMEASGLNNHPLND